MAITVDKKSCSVSLDFYTTQRYGPKNGILIYNLFWDCRSVTVAPLLDGMSEEQEKLYGVQFRVCSVVCAYMGWKRVEINYLLPTCTVLSMQPFIFVIGQDILIICGIFVDV